MWQLFTIQNDITGKNPIPDIMKNSHDDWNDGNVDVISDFNKKVP